jgi:flagellar basal-body rod protein FlgB
VTISDPTMDVLYQSLRGLAARQRATADNIANVQTPGFLANKVDFESSLQRAISGGAPASATVESTRSTEPTRQDGNNVNLDDETLSMVDTNLRYQTMVEAMNAKFRLLRTAMGA